MISLKKIVTFHYGTGKRPFSMMPFIDETINDLIPTLKKYGYKDEIDFYDFNGNLIDRNTKIGQIPTEPNSPIVSINVKNKIPSIDFSFEISVTQKQVTITEKVKQGTNIQKDQNIQKENYQKAKEKVVKENKSSISIQPKSSPKLATSFISSSKPNVEESKPQVPSKNTSQTNKQISTKTSDQSSKQVQLKPEAKPQPQSPQKSKPTPLPTIKSENTSLKEESKPIITPQTKETQNTHKENDISVNQSFDLNNTNESKESNENNSPRDANSNDSLAMYLQIGYTSFSDREKEIVDAINQLGFTRPYIIQVFEVADKNLEQTMALLSIPSSEPTLQKFLR